MNEGSGKNKVMMIVIILLLVLLLATIGGLSWYVLNELNKERPDVEVTPPPVQNLLIEDYVTFQVGTISTNFLNEGNTRGHMFQADISFEINGVLDEEGILYDLMTARLDMIRSIINSIVRNTTHAEYNAVNGDERLKERILESISEHLQTNIIVRVNFSAVRAIPI